MKSLLTVSCFQPDIRWEAIDHNLQTYTEQLHTLSAETDILVLPEMFSTGFSMRPAELAEPKDGKTHRWLRKLSQQHQTAVVASVIIRENGQFFNRLFWVQPDGSSQCYDKRHLFSLSEEPRRYRAGQERLIVDYLGWKICPLVCYDLRFPVWSRNTSAYDLLVYVANWPESRRLHWQTLLRARAIENQVYTIGVNRVGVDGHGANHSGDSSVIDYAGEILAQVSTQPQIFTVQLAYDQQQIYREKFPFLRDGDAFQVMI